jgi:hypothetical protein
VAWTRWLVTAAGLWWCPSLNRWVSGEEGRGRSRTNMVICRNMRAALRSAHAAQRVASVEVNLTCQRLPRGRAGHLRARIRDYTLPAPGNGASEVIDAHAP